MSNPAVGWAVYPWDVEQVSYNENLCDSSCATLPNKGDLIIRPCLVRPETYEPISVRVDEILDPDETEPHTLVFLVVPVNLLN
ncbi:MULTISPECIES: hypothetical protein [Nitrosomonas]|uniref:Uncharacterized protein n=1 Tax=Nitrosomonas communis TaxID=44574 RepID=A0A0F7KJQ6_9PROT|nr:MULTISPECIES: hypothetical protein [Nitrosomonas]AKH39179.1 hypothetical protein AAW31_17315 [Nitrosomonas communis]TYP71565.1 hypothetical protein BCL69_11132 [Nitrosomonas communis]UVS61363.1 hypothetical protein NX761_18130 [Nitrosomonas sp. PLL12]